MSTFKKSQVVMLSTNQKAKEGMLCLMKHRLGTYRLNTITAIAQQRDGLKVWVNNGHLVELDNKIYLRENFPYIGYQHLYFLSDEEIKVGDWWYNSSTGLIFQVSSDNVAMYNQNSNMDRTGLKKIIATTDKSLGEIPNSIPGFNFPDKLGLPQPSQQFIEIFVKEYNKGNIITEVMVEYEAMNTTIVGRKYNDFEPKINPKDNTITIRKVKDSWSREEVEEKLNDLHLFIRANAISDNSVRILISKMVKEWIKENL